jgi:exodeoxyribonuclease VII large subunit
MAEKLSLTELQLIIRDSLYMALPDMYWVIAEISEMKENYAGHCYLELIEKHPDDKNVKARARAIIWNNRYRFLKSLFENITGESLKEGFNILIKVKVEYHELYGLSLVITDIDPAYTIGEMAMKRQLVIKRLEEEGVFSMNKELELPVLPQRIAVISSINAAGYSDFINHLKGNSFGYAFYSVLIESVMQGSDTEHGIITALDRIADHSNLFDLVVIIRGGGSQSDLSWFDSYNIAYHITQFPLPVITGIGHEKDVSVTDMVANKSLKTPTAVADFIIEMVADAEAHLSEVSSEIRSISQKIIEKNKNVLETSAIKLLPLARLMLSDIKDKISRQIMDIINTGKESVFKAGMIPANHRSRLLSGAKAYSIGKETILNQVRQKTKNITTNTLRKNILKVDGYENSLSILNPENVLKRGFTITSLNGRILKKTELVKTNDVIDTIFIDGTLTSKVMNKKERSKLSGDSVKEKR